jgi:hypothetical protein
MIFLECLDIRRLDLYRRAGDNGLVVSIGALESSQHSQPSHIPPTKLAEELSMSQGSPLTRENGS